MAYLKKKIIKPYSPNSPDTPEHPKFRYRGVDA